MQTSLKIIFFCLLAMLWTLFLRLCNPEKPLKIEPPPVLGIPR